MMKQNRWRFQLLSLLSLLLITVLIATQVNEAKLIPLPKVSRSSQAAQVAHQTESGQSKEQDSPGLYELEPIDLSGDTLDTSQRMIISRYNQNFQQIQQLPLEAKQQEISAEDNKLQKLLKQQWNTALDLYRLTRLRILAGVRDDFNNDSIDEVAMGAIRLTLAEKDLVTTTGDKLAAYETCSFIATQWQTENQALERAGVGIRFSVLEATYWRQYCEIQATQEQSQEQPGI